MKKILFGAIICLVSCDEQQKPVIQKSHLGEFHLIKQLATLDEKMPPTQPGEWLSEHPETGQTLDQYLLVTPVMPNDSQKVIYLQPIGTFNLQQDSLIQCTAEYLEIFFNLKTTVLPVISDSLIPNSSRRMREDSSEQLLTTFILDSLLKGRSPKDAIVTMAVTEKDLYPQPSWNYVFGQAYTRKRTGVSSFYRYYNEEKDARLCLKRLIKTSSHEISHMFSILHCTNAVCVMNGTNHLPETDTKPNRLCSVCLSKLYWNLEFDNVKRLSALKAFFEKYELTSDYILADKDLTLISGK